METAKQDIANQTPHRPDADANIAAEGISLTAAC